MLLRIVTSRPGAALGLACGVATCLGNVACASDSAESTDAPTAPSFEDANDDPPVFAGVTRATAVSDHAVELEWAPGIDDRTRRGSLTYRVYRGVGDGPVDISTPAAVSIPGQTELVVDGLDTARDYRFVVRAVDAAGNEDDNVSAVRVSLADTTAPEFEGITGALPETSSRILVQWKPAADNGTPRHELTYRVFASENRDDVFEHPIATSLPGATSVVVSDQPKDTELFVAVRAVDGSGNLDENQRVVSSAMPEGTPPEFLGVRWASASRDAVELSWTPASDETTASSAIVYAVYAARTSGGQNLLEPMVVTDAGVTRWKVTGLDSNETYYFIVRARDRAGNEDGNTAQLSVTTLLPDVTPPTFGGATSTTSTTPSSYRIDWSPATDDVSEARHIRYNLYVASSPGAQDFTEPTLTTLPGRSSVVFLGQPRATGFAVVVRSLDEAGNEDENTTEVFATTLSASADVTPPTLTGDITVSRVPSRPDWLYVTFPGAMDDTEGLGGIRYHVCVGASSLDCAGSQFQANINATSDFGAGGVFVTGLSARKIYSVTVRPEDRGGNLGIGATAMGTTATSFAKNVLPVLESRCNQCHSYSYGTLVHVPAGYDDATYGALSQVFASDGQNSYLYRKLLPLGSEAAPFSEASPNAYDGVRMPSDGTDPLSDEVTQAIFDWIEQGAFDN